MPYHVECLKHESHLRAIETGGQVGLGIVLLLHKLAQLPDKVILPLRDVLGPPLDARHFVHDCRSGLLHWLAAHLLVATHGLCMVVLPFLWILSKSERRL